MPKTFAQINNEFALGLYGQLRQYPGNLFFSPFSIHIALAMAQAGAKGQTAAQMSEVLGPSGSDPTITKVLESARHAGEYELNIANALWGQEGAALEAQFLDLIARLYDGGLHLVDFRNNSESARIAINRWVENKTKEKIRDLIPSGGLNADTRLVLANAIYFKGRWLLKFSSKGTREESFYVDAGTTVEAPLMFQQDDIPYMEGRGYQAVDLAYRGGDLSMLVILPEAKDGLPDLEKQISPKMIQECASKTRDREVKLFLPRFKMTWGTVDLRDQLTTLGMTFAFDRSRADFSGINGHEPPHEDALSISSVFHKAFVDVNEEGTEAAAATAVAMVGMSMPDFDPPPIPLFRADHPFLFAIRHTKSGAMLFLGRVTDPTRGS